MGSERSQQPGSLAYEHFHTENNYGQHTHVSDEAVIGRNFTDRRTTGRRPCDWSNGQNTTQLMPHYNCISKSINQWQHHKPYTDHLLDEYNFAAGKAFVYCHKGSVSLLHTLCTQLHSHLPCSTADCHVCVQHAPLQVEPCFGAAKVQQTNFY